MIMMIISIVFSAKDKHAGKLGSVVEDLKLNLLDDETNVMRCAIWYHLYNFKNVKNTHGGVAGFSLIISDYIRPIS